jgi:hypothetical protein
MVAVEAKYGQDKEVIFSRIYVPSNSGGILDLARDNNWSLSLRDLIQFRFPESAERMQRLLDLNANRLGSSSPEELAALTAEYGFDLESWRSVDYEVPKPLFETWSGTTRLLPESETS